MSDSTKNQEEEIKKEEVEEPTTYLYPLPQGMTFKDLAFYPKAKIEAIDLIMVPTNKNNTKNTNKDKKKKDQRQGEGEEEKENGKETEEEEEPPQVIITDTTTYYSSDPKKKKLMASFLEESFITSHAFSIVVDQGPKLTGLNSIFLATLVGNVDYLRTILEDSNLRKLAFYTNNNTNTDADRKDDDGETTIKDEEYNSQEEDSKHNKKNKNVPVSSAIKTKQGRTLAEIACRCSRQGSQREILELFYKNKIFDVVVAAPVSQSSSSEKEIEQNSPQSKSEVVKVTASDSSTTNTKNHNLLNQPNAVGTYPLFILAQEGNIEGLKFAHEVCGMSLTTKHKDDELNAFIIAVRFEKIEIVKYYLEKAKSEPEIKKLVESNISVRSSTGVLFGIEGAFTVACSVGSGNVELVKMLFEAGLHKPALLEAQEHSRPMKILRVSKKDADAATRKDPSKVYRKYKYFPVLPDSCTASKSSPEKHQVLGVSSNHYQLSVGGDRSECNAPLHAAIIAKDLAVVRFLCQVAGFDIDKDAVVGLRTPLQIACRHGLTDVAEFLVSAVRCDVNKKSKDGSFPLYTAAFQANDALVELLLRNGANTSFTWHNATPFFAAVSQSNLSTAKLLFDNKADVSTQFEGRTPTQYARERGLQEMLMFLETNRVY